MANLLLMNYVEKGLNMVADNNLLNSLCNTIVADEQLSISYLNEIPNPIVIINPDTSIRYINPAFENLTGYQSQEIVGKKLPYPWWTKETIGKCKRDYQKAVKYGGIGIEELFQKKK